MVCPSLVCSKSIDTVLVGCGRHGCEAKWVGFWRGGAGAWGLGTHLMNGSGVLINTSD